APGGKRSRDREDDRESSAVVADAWSAQPTSITSDTDLSAFWKHRIEVRCNHNVWSDGDTRPVAEHVACAIEPDVRQARLLECGFHRCRSGALVKWRRGNLANTNLIAYQFRLVGFQRLEGSGDRRLGDQA